MKDTKKTAFKSVNAKLELKDLDEGSRKVKVMLSAFNVKDSDSDVIRPGAFAKSIAERGPASAGNRKIAFLRDHDWKVQIGAWDELYEDKDGLIGVGSLGRSSKGTDALYDYQDGIIKEHSIGFQYVSGKIEMVEDDATFGDYFNITEVKLWEGSAVTFGANEFTPVLDVAKGANVLPMVEDYCMQLKNISAALKNGNGTDERLLSLESDFDLISQKLKTLFESVKPANPKDEATSKAEEKPQSEKTDKPGIWKELLNL